MVIEHIDLVMARHGGAACQSKPQGSWGEKISENTSSHHTFIKKWLYKRNVSPTKPNAP